MLENQIKTSVKKQPDLNLYNSKTSRQNDDSKRLQNRKIGGNLTKKRDGMDLQKDIKDATKSSGNVTKSFIVQGKPGTNVTGVSTHRNQNSAATNTKIYPTSLKKKVVQAVKDLSPPQEVVTEIEHNPIDENMR